MDIQKVPAVERRIETGAVQFGDDWPGTFIRGDDAIYYAWGLDNIMREHGDKINWMDRMCLENMIAAMTACRVNIEPEQPVNEAAERARP